LSDLSDKEKREKLERSRYRFEGVRYSMRGPSTSGSLDMIPQNVSLYAFPRPSITPSTLLDLDD